MAIASLDADDFFGWCEIETRRNVLCCSEIILKMLLLVSVPATYKDMLALTGQAKEFLLHRRLLR